MFKRFALFFAVNMLIVVTISIVTSVLGLNSYMTAQGLDYNALAGFCLVWGMGGAFISLAISRISAKWMMGVKVIDPKNISGTEGWLVQTVHNLARAANLPAMPEVGIYDSPDVNAFATGPTKTRSLVAVSSGLLQSMSQDEAEGVLAHEVAHIQNGDMVTMTLVQGIINAFVMFFARIIGYAVAQAIASRSDREEGASPMVQMVVTIVLEIALAFLGMIAAGWFSRHREFRADAGSAKLAGREKMIAALEKLQRVHGHVETEEHQSLAALKISGKNGGFFALLATHPPLEDRIAALKRGI